MKIIGLSAFYHDSAAALVQDGELICAAQEERFTRKRHDSDFPEKSISFCLKQNHLKLDDIDAIVFYEKPFLKFERLIETYLNFAPKGFLSFKTAMPIWQKKLFQKHVLIRELEKINSGKKIKSEILFSKHHQAHGASAFFPSPFEEAAIVTMDGVGEWTTTSLGIGAGRDFKINKEIHFPHSLGLLYSSFTYYLGFKVNSGEYKVMGLAPYGVPRFKDLILNNLIDVKEDGSFRLNLTYFDFCTGLKMTNQSFDKLFDGPPRKPEEQLTQKHMDLAASIQNVLEEIVIKITSFAAHETKMKNLCLAGGVALNCVANGKILKESGFKNIWIQPASGDAGGAIGAAFAAYYQNYKNQRILKQGKDKMCGGFLGPSFSQTEIEDSLRKNKAQFQILKEDEIYLKTSQALSKEQAVGWFQGAMEFGPRALGARSILGDPRSPQMQKILNLKIKFRESFRPFAPAILREDLKDWYDLDTDSPYMLLVAEVNDAHKLEMPEKDRKLFGIELLNTTRSRIPAVTHVDYSARIQTVHRDTNMRFYKLLESFKFHTGCPILVNTSFNVRGEPIVCTPDDAFRCFMGTDIEVLVIGNCYLEKKDQDKNLVNFYYSEMALD